jgi:hypothetical protein
MASPELEILELAVEVWVKDTTNLTDEKVKAQIAEMYIEAEKFVTELQTKYPHLNFVLA